MYATLTRNTWLANTCIAFLSLCLCFRFGCGNVPRCERAWTPCGMPGGAEQFVDFWTPPSSHAQVRQALAKRGVSKISYYEDAAIFHLRCSDVGPYDQGQLSLYATKAATIINRCTDCKRVVISWCGSHHGGGEIETPTAHCSQMSKLVQNILEGGTGLPAPVECWELKETWDVFYSAALLIGTTGTLQRSDQRSSKDVCSERGWTVPRVRSPCGVSLILLA